MSDLRQAAQHALEVLEALQGGCTDHDDGTFDAITVWCPEITEDLRAALAEPEQPVACSNTFSCRCPKHFNSPTPRRPLSLDEIQHCADEAGLTMTKRLRCFARAIERYHGITNETN